jgi:hypothetical protein
MIRHRCWLRIVAIWADAGADVDTSNAISITAMEVFVRAVMCGSPMDFASCVFSELVSKFSASTAEHRQDKGPVDGTAISQQPAPPRCPWIRPQLQRGQPVCQADFLPGSGEGDQEMESPQDAGEQISATAASARDIDPALKNEGWAEIRLPDE